MTNPVTINFELIEAAPELQLIQLLIDVSNQFNSELSSEARSRAIKYFNDRHEQREPVAVYCRPA